SQQSSSNHQQQQAPPSLNPPSQIGHPAQQPSIVQPGYPPQPSTIYVQHATYQQGYGQQPHGFQQSGGVRQIYPQQPGAGVALQHCYTNNDEIVPSVAYGAEWRVPDGDVQPQWQHTQSYSTIPTAAYQQGSLHSWDSQVVYAAQPAPFNKAQNSQSQQQPMFYVPETFENSPSTKSVSYFGQSIDGYHVPLHAHSTVPGAGTSPANYSQPPPPIQHGPPHPGYQQQSVPQPPVDTYASAVQRSEKELEMMRHQLGTALPERPKSFDPSVQQLLASRRLDQSALVNMYLKCGGQQWAEAVDLDLAMTVVKYCMDSRIDGAILVFLPGFDDIVQMRDKITSESWTGRRPVIFTLHSQMNSFDQQKVFDAVGPNERKVILSTNIAEASLTIDDVVFVIDCGKVKEKTYDHTSRISQLKVTWIAKSNAEQRAGRAGRCREGFCFRLYSIEDYEVMLETQMAEMQRTAIHEARDRLRLRRRLNGPYDLYITDNERIRDGMMAIETAVSCIWRPHVRCRCSCTPITGALNDRFGEMVASCLLGSQLRYCFQMCVFEGHPFLLYWRCPRNESNRIVDAVFGKRDFSDHITLIQEAIAVCVGLLFVLPADEMIAGIRYSSCWPMVQAAIVAGCYPGIGFVRAGNKLKKIRTRFTNGENDEGIDVKRLDMKRLIQLRFKVMSYFLAAIHKPQLLTNPQKEDLDLLETLALVLKTDHQQMKFNTCVLPEQQFIFQQHQVPTSSSTSSYSSHNGQATALRFSHREGTSSQPNMSALAEVPPKSVGSCKWALGASNSEALPPAHSAANFQAGGYEDNDPPDGNRSPPPVQQDRDPQDRYVGQRQQPRRQLSAQDDYGYQKNRRDNYDPRRFTRNRDDWQRNRPYQPREGFRDKVERSQNFRDRDRERNARDDTGPGPSSQQQPLPRQRIQGYNNRDRDYRQNDREWSRGEQISDSIRSDLDQLTWQQREMERNDNYRDRQGRRDYNYRQRQYTKYDDDREEPALGASNSEALPPAHSAANFQAGGYEDNDPPDGNRSPPPVQQDRDPQDRYVGQRQQPRRQLSAQDDYGYQKNRRDNYDPRRFTRNRDDWQRNRPYQPREGFRDKVERSQNFRDRDRERNARDDTGPGPSSQQQPLPRQRIQGYNNRDRDYRQNDREWSRGEQISDSIRSDLDQLTWQQREMERNDNYRDRQGRRDYNYRQRQYTKYDDDREEPVPEDPRVDRNDDDGWGEAEYQAAGYHHDQQDHQHKHNRQYHRPYNRGGYRGRSRGYFNNRQSHYNRDDGRREMQDDERGDRDSGDNKDHELNR
ncbi:helicase protein, partial [Ostertagia ostertagi]